MYDTVCGVLADQLVIHSYLETTTTHKQCLHDLNQILSANKHCLVFCHVYQSSDSVLDLEVNISCSLQLS